MHPIGNPMIFHRYPLEEALRLTAGFGYKKLEIWPRQIEMFTTESLRREFAAQAAALGFSLVRLNAAAADYFTPLNSRRSAKGILAGLKRDIDAARSLGMSQLLTWEGRRPEHARRRDIHGWILGQTAGIFREAVAYGKSQGVSLSVEVHPFTLGMDLDFLTELCDRLDSDWFGVTYDCCHFGVGMPDGYVEAITRLGHRIKHVHFSDSDRKSSELHFAVGTGSLELDEITAALKAIRFQGTMMLDLWLYPLPEAGTKLSLPYVIKVMKTLGLRG